MVPVAQHHVLNVARGPLAKDFVVSVRAGLAFVPAFDPLVLPGGPLVEGFVHHQQAQAVAEIVQFGRHGVVRAADGIDADAFQNLQAAFQGGLREGRAQAAEIVVQAHALQFLRFSIEEEAEVRVEAQRANSE